MHSMTGFGRGSAAFGEGRIVIEIKSVNHRYLEARSRAPREFLTAESLVERLIRKKLSRGFCTVNIWYEGNRGGTTAIDKEALKNHLESLIAIGNEMELCLADLVPVLASSPDLFTTPRIDDEEAFNKSVNAAFTKAIEKLIAMRNVEGDAMSDDLKHRHGLICDQVKALEKETSCWPAIALTRIKERLKVLLEDKDISLISGRAEAEAAILVDRGDVTEEITRLKSHCDQMAALFETQEPAGRKIEFLIQEMGREINTVGSKTAMPEITPRVIDIKAELEKMRELAQNIE
ncbi:MAG: YicC family protein [Proteobacteria bacterium]|nr:YicC family protein [Pseudomonadota bacterium]